MSRILAFITLLLLAGQAPAAHPTMSERESLEQQFQQATGVRQTELLLQLAPLYYEQDYQQGAEMLRAQLAKHPEASVLRAQLLRWLATLTFSRSDWTEIEILATEGLEIARELGSIDTELDLLNVLGAVHYRLVNYGQAMDFYLEAVALAEQSGYREKLPKPLTNIAGILADRDDYDGAKRYLTRSIEIERQLGEDTSVSEIALVEVYTKQQQPQQARALLDRVYQRLLQSPQPLGGNYAETLYYIADSYLLLSLPAEALEVAERSEARLLRRGASLHLTMNYRIKSTALAALGRISEALAESDKALAMSREVFHEEVEADVLRSRAEMFETTGNYQEALAAFKQYKILSDELVNLDKANSTKHLHNKVALAEKSRQLQQLRQQQELEELDRQQELLLWRLSMAVLCLMIVSSIGGIIYIASRKRAAETAYRHLQQTQQQLIEYEKMSSSNRWIAGVTQQIQTPLAVVSRVTAMLAERCLATDPSLERGFNTVEVNLEKLSSLVAKLREMVKETAAEPWQVIRLAQLFDNCLAPMKGTIARQGVTVDLECDPHLEITSCPNQLSRVIAELAGNSLEHAFEHQPAPRLSLAVRRENEFLVIRYADNGQGISHAVSQSMFQAFNTSKTKQGHSGLGLHLVYSLVHQQLHGDIRQVETGGEGVCFDIYLPQQPPSAGIEV